MPIRLPLLLRLITGLSFAVYCQPLLGQQHYHHNVVWGRLALTDTISKQLRWEVYLQNRRQNSPPHTLNVFDEEQFVSYWAWLTYSLPKGVRIAVSPFGFFKSWLLIANPSEADRPAVKELRWALRVDHEQRFTHLIYTNRYGIEYRWRDLKNDGVYLPNWRLRYQVRLEKPIRAAWINRPLSLVVSDEIFVQFGRAVRANPNVFDQNRLYGGFNYGLTPNIKMSLGYIYQIQQRNSGKEFDHANVLWGVLTFDNLFSQFKRKHY